MAVWRTKACELFGFAANEYSYASGKVELFADLLHLAFQSCDDLTTLGRIAEYVTWATEQNSDELASAVDLAFLFPMFRDQRIFNLLADRFSPKLLATKHALFFDEIELSSQRNECL